MSETLEIPTGFERHFRQSPLTEPWEPLYSRREAKKIVLGLRLRPAHCNHKGFAHGGLIASLADNAMGLSCGQAAGETSGFVTVSLTVDYLKPAAVGQWLEFDSPFVKTGSTLSFAQAFVTADGEPCARANAVFRALARS
jgi:uncharacterized protein (TIGR00369 family)